MEVQNSPSGIDEPNLLYKLQRKIKVFSTSNNLPFRGYNLLTTSTKYGLVFIASPQGTLCVYNIRDLIDKDNVPRYMSVKLQIQPTHVAANCDQEWLAVLGGSNLLIFNIADFQNPNVGPSATIKLDVQPTTYVSSVQWNPCIPDTIAIVYFDGTLVVSQVSTMQTKKIQSIARCMCWSPKGKQLVTGNIDGTIYQYKPDLTQMKTVVAPNLFQNAPHEVMAIYWISTYQFAIVYKNSNDNSRPAVTIVSTPKGGTPVCLNYEDICYSMGSNRPWYYFLIGFTQWNLILSSSSNSMEIATLGSKNGVEWLQWWQSDEARPELPITDKKQENYPVGICINTSAVHQIPWGENEVLPPMPMLLVLSQTGLLTIFNIVNQDKGAAQVCTPIQPLTLPASALTSDIPDEGQPQKPEPQPQQPSQLQQALQSPVQQPQVIPQQTLQQPVSQHLQPTSQPLKPIQPALPKVEQTSQSFTKPTPAPPSFGNTQQTTTAQTKSQAKTVEQVTNSPTRTAQAEMNAALKSEQEKANKAKMNQELKNMLIKEINDFQIELYQFMKFTRERQNETQTEINMVQPSIELHGLDPEQVRKHCNVEDLRDFIIQLKLELVRACAVIAEARTHSEVQVEHEWTQADPLTTKRFASIKQLAYYVQNQLEQAQKALDWKWNEISKQYSKPGQRMIRPILDDVYQPLVKQQDILTRQQAVLKTLRNTMKECGTTPLIKTTSLLRSTPFKNKDPLSKLTKNILNMSIEPQKNKDKELLSSQKLDALRDALCNHKPRKIKPVSIEIHQQLAQRLKQKYEKGIKDQEEKEKNSQVNQIVIKEEIKVEPSAQFQKSEIVNDKLDQIKQHPITIPAVADNKPAVANVARTLAFDEPKKEAVSNTFVAKVPEQHKVQPPTLKINPQPSKVNEAFIKNNEKYIDNSAGETTVLAKLLSEDGPKICSPTAFSFSKPPSTATQSNMFSSKPIADMTNMFSKFAQSPPTETKATLFKVPPKSGETGEPENPIAMSNIFSPKPTETSKVIKPIQNMFSLKTSTPLSSVQNVPDVLRSNKASGFGKTDTTAESKENNQRVVDLNTAEEKKEIGKPFTIQSTIALPPSSPTQSVFVVDLKKPNEIKIEKSLPSSFFTQPTSSAVCSQGVSSQTSGTISIVATSGTSITDVSKKLVTSTVTSTTVTQTKKEPENVIETSKPEVLAKSIAMATLSDTTATITVSSSPKPVSSSADSVSIESDAVSTKIETLQETAGSVISSEGERTKETTTSTTSTVKLPQSIFGSAQQNDSEPTTPIVSSINTTSAQSVFSAANKVAFGIASTPSVFGTSTTQAPSFDSTAPTFGSTQSVFGTTPSSPAPVTQASPFSSGQSTPPSSFGTTSTQASIFGTPSTPTTTTQSIFGASPSTSPSAVFASAQSSTFGAPSAQSSVFGQSATTQASIFGGTTNQSSIFGSNSTASSVFGTATSQASSFGAQTTQASVFGPATTQAPVFGSSQASVFGAPTSTASVFGSATPTTQTSLFGSPTTTTQSGSLFGDGGASLFAAASISTTTASPQSGGSIFGGSPGSSFGNANSNVFGGKATFSGTNSTAASIFAGGTSTFGQKPAPAQDFWGGGAGSSTGFGSGFGQQANNQSSLFGSSGGSFSQPSTGQPFSSPQSKPGFGSPQPASPAFGSSPVFGNKPAFGSPSSYGGSGFGAINTSPGGGFGSSATFGGGATFGATAFGSTSPGKVFGGSSPSFSTPTQSNATFENLATQNTMTFGNLAQQSPPTNQATPSFNTSPSFTAWRG